MTATDSTPKAFSYIRFSTPEQLKGDSLRRQLKSSIEYAESHGLVLDESLSMKDLGLSAYYGENRTKGALGKFLELVDTGKIPYGSTLIVESLDRLSREQVLDALTRFIEIINRGIRIVTLTDGMEYSRETVEANWTKLIMSLTIMARAHEESATKSKRGLAAWEAKRRGLDKTKLTGRCPAWLHLAKDNKRFDLITKRVELIQRIFNLCLSGNGADKIHRILNAEKIPAWVSKNGWHKSYIQKILHNRAVIGEYQPHKIDKSKGSRRRIPVGSPLPGYYPAIIDKNDFYRVQEMLSANLGKGGKNGAVNNLFGHIAKCGYCGRPMQFLDKGKGQRYLMCDSARRGLGCQKASYWYDEFEETFLKFCGQLSVSVLIPSDSRRTLAIDELKSKLLSIDGQLVTARKKKNNADKAMAMTDDEATLKHLTRTLTEVIGEETKLAEQRATFTAAIKKAESLIQHTAREIESIKQLISYMASAEGSERAKIRTKLKSEIRMIVRLINVFPNGLQNRVLTWSSEMQYSIVDENGPKQIEEIGFDSEIFRDRAEYESVLEKAKAKNVELDKFVEDHTGKDKRGFAIHFAAGGFREVFMKNGDYEIGTSFKDEADMEKSFYELVGESPGEADSSNS